MGDAANIPEMISNHGVPVALLAALLWTVYRHVIPMLRDIAARHLSFLDAVQAGLQRSEDNNHNLLLQLREQQAVITDLLREQRNMRYEIRRLAEATERGVRIAEEAVEEASDGKADKS